ncbi:hypothetical protein [Amphiplicatus metriothermophilus]|nr:hypothetical protein [Amphiplicatus metriothermophilus]MBB5518621.1 hypothetical protein [Amphiplicatus metriothermophilus]
MREMIPHAADRKADALPYLARFARAADAGLGAADFLGKSGLVAAMTALVPFYWNPPLWVALLTWPRGVEADRLRRRPQRVAGKGVPSRPAGDPSAANDNRRTRPARQAA